jgi:hypothetical protein
MSPTTPAVVTKSPQQHPHFKDETDHRYVFLRVLEFAGWRTRVHKKGYLERNARWLVQCRCGTTKIVDGKSMRSGATRSCDHCSALKGPENRRRWREGIIPILQRDDKGRFIAEEKTC